MRRPSRLLPLPERKRPQIRPTRDRQGSKVTENRAGGKESGHAENEAGGDESGPPEDPASEGESSPTEDLKVVVSIRGGNTTIGVQRALGGPPHRVFRRNRAVRAGPGSHRRDREGASQVGGVSEVSRIHTAHALDQTSAPGRTGIGAGYNCGGASLGRGAGEGYRHRHRLRPTSRWCIGTTMVLVNATPIYSEEGATMFERLPQSAGHLTLHRGERYPRRDIQHRGKLPDRPVDRQQGNRC